MSETGAVKNADMATTNQIDLPPSPIPHELLEWAEYWYPIAWKGLIIAGVITALGAVATIIFLLLQWRTTSIREDQSEWRTASLELQAAKLTRDSEQLRKDTAVANARAAEAELKLAEFRKPRLVPETIATKLIEALKPFAGTKFDIGHAPVGREQWDFMWQLEPVLAKAGWEFLDWTGGNAFAKLNWTMTQHIYGVANVLNVSIEVDASSRETLLPSANALADALNSVGIAAVVEPNVISSTSHNTGAVHLLVGEKR